MSKIKEATLKTMKNGKISLKLNLNMIFTTAKFVPRCVTCKRWESQIKCLKNFTSKWLGPSVTTIDKDCVKKNMC